MLQINSGKLYPAGVGRTNQLRGVLYSNLNLAALRDAPIATAGGTLLAADPFGDPKSLVYELTEQMDDGRKASGVLVSHGVLPYMEDFAVVVSFALRCICTPDVDLCRRLLSGKRSLRVDTPPPKLVRRVFDRDIWLQPADREELVSFVADLIALRRKSFLAAMKAIRTYVAGLHRIADDLELGYTLLVASLESLAQDFDGHAGQWEDYDPRNRSRIDRALAGADQATTEKVRTALIEIEHLAIARRFRDFTMDHLSKIDLQEPDRVGALGRLDLLDGLREAYRLRSRYIHNLEGLPDLLSVDLSFNESIRAEHTIFLTIEGLARVGRRVILEFVKRQPKVETEVYDYHLERHGIIQAEMSPEYWIGDPRGIGPDSGRQWLEAFLQQWSHYLMTKTRITPLVQVTPRIEEMLPNLNSRQRTPFLALYCIYNNLMPPDARPASFAEVVEKYDADLMHASFEALSAHTALNVLPTWSVDEHQKLLDDYFQQRNQKRGFRMPELFEAGAILDIAERYRANGEFDAARELLAFAADNLPGLPPLQALEQGFDREIPLRWDRILLPEPTPALPDATPELPPSVEPT